MIDGSEIVVLHVRSRLIAQDELARREKGGQGRHVMLFCSLRRDPSKEQQLQGDLIGWRKDRRGCFGRGVLEPSLIAAACSRVSASHRAMAIGALLALP